VNTVLISTQAVRFADPIRSEADRLLRKGAVIYGFGFLLHNADHARRTIAASPEAVVWAGTATAMLTTVIFTLIAVRHPRAGLVSAVSAAMIAIGVSAVHLLPKWGFLSDPLPGGDVYILTWVAVLAEIGGAIALAGFAFRSTKVQG
jgi:hypothetical protein